MKDTINKTLKFLIIRAKIMKNNQNDKFKINVLFTMNKLFFIFKCNF